MKQTLEEVAKENILFNHRTVDRTLSGGNLAQFGITNFIQGAEWQAKQSPWISVKDKLPDNQNIVLVRDEYGGFCTAYLHGLSSPHGSIPSAAAICASRCLRSWS